MLSWFIKLYSKSYLFRVFFYACLSSIVLGGMNFYGMYMAPYEHPHIRASYHIARPNNLEHFSPMLNLNFKSEGSGDYGAQIFVSSGMEQHATVREACVIDRYFLGKGDMKWVFVDTNKELIDIEQFEDKAEWEDRLKQCNIEGYHLLTKFEFFDSLPDLPEAWDFSASTYWFTATIFIVLFFGLAFILGGIAGLILAAIPVWKLWGSKNT